MEAREREKLVAIVGAEDAAAVERFLGDCALCTLVEAADGADSDWPEWARAAAVLQRWLEAAGRDADRAGIFRSSSESIASSPPNTSMSSPDVMSDHRFCIHALVRWCMYTGSHSDDRTLYDSLSSTRSP